MKAYTDYPLLPKDRTCPQSGRLAPIREVELIGWDNNKYCLIRFEGKAYHLKLGYVYQHCGRCGEVQSVNRKDVPVIDVWDEDKYGEIIEV